MTRADDLLAAMRREGETLAGLRNERGEQDPLYLAWRDLDDFMASFGVLPSGWRVRVAEVARRPVSPEVRARAAAKLGVVVQNAMAELGYQDQGLSGAVARAVLEVMMEEQREAELFHRYWAAYGPWEVAKRMAEPVSWVIAEEPGHGPQGD